MGTSESRPINEGEISSDVAWEGGVVVLEEESESPVVVVHNKPVDWSIIDPRSPNKKRTPIREGSKGIRPVNTSSSSASKKSSLASASGSPYKAPSARTRQVKTYDKDSSSNRSSNDKENQRLNV